MWERSVLGMMEARESGGTIWYSAVVAEIQEKPDHTERRYDTVRWRPQQASQVTTCLTEGPPPPSRSSLSLFCNKSLSQQMKFTIMVLYCNEYGYSNCRKKMGSVAFHKQLVSSSSCLQHLWNDINVRKTPGPNRRIWRKKFRQTLGKNFLCHVCR